MSATVNVTFPAAPADEQVTKYDVFQDGVLAATVNPTAGATSESASIPNVTPGVHAYTVQASNIWGPGPVSDPASTPPVCGKVINVSISITIA
jgi:hypothetical protein